MSKKLIAFALAGIFALSMVAPAKAATIEELTILFNDLLAKYNVLLAQVGQPTGAAAVCFNTDLQKGMTSDDVKNLQIKLGVTPTSGYFGSITFAAVKTFQTANGIINTGYVGPLTRGALNALYCVAVTPVTTYPAGCTSAVGFSTTTGLPCSTTVTYPEGCTSAVGFSPTTGLSCAGTTTTTVAPSYGTLSVVSYPVSNPQTTWYGANTYEVVAGQYKATGSDITVKKVAVKITSDTATAFPWQAFTTISVWDGSTKLAELPVTSANAIETTFAQVYTFNISGFNWVIPSGQQKVLTVKMTTVPNPPTAVTTASFWKMELLTDVVYSDTAGVTYSLASGSAIPLDNVTLTSSQAATLTVTSATDNPLAGNVIGSTSATSKVDVLKFNIKAENVNSTLTSGTIKVATDGTTVTNAYVTSLELWDGFTMVAAAAPSGWASDVGTSTWTGFSLPISAGTTKTLTVKAVLAQLPTSYTNDGTGYLKITTGPTLTGIDANSNVVSNASTVTGNNMYPFLVAPAFAYVSKSVSIRGTNSTTNPQDIGDTTITFSVTANGGDIYIPEKSNTSVLVGMSETLTGGTATVAATGSITFTGTGTATGTATVTINGTDVTYTYTTSTTATSVASQIVTAIGNNTTTNALVAAASSDGTVNLTAQTAGYAGNSITYSATTTASTGITASPSVSTNLTGGLDSQSTSTTWTCNSPAVEDTSLGDNDYLWRITSGSTANCTFSTLVTNTAGTAGYFRVALGGVKWYTSATSTSSSFITQNWGLTNINTGAFYLGI